MFCKCDYCGEPFNSFGPKICGKCSKELDEIFTKVRRYMYSVGGAVTAEQITEELEVPEKAVLYLIETGRIVTTSELGWHDKCGVCGKAVPNGTSMCPTCSKSVLSGLNKFKDDRAAELLKEIEASKNRVRPMMGKDDK